MKQFYINIGVFTPVNRVISTARIKCDCLLFLCTLQVCAFCLKYYLFAVCFHLSDTHILVRKKRCKNDKNHKQESWTILNNVALGTLGITQHTLALAYLSGNPADCTISQLIPKSSQENNQRLSSGLGSALEHPWHHFIY